MNMLRVLLDEIEVGDRLREIDPDYAALLADSLDEHGQMQPIEVRGTPGGRLPFGLVTGGHRIAAARLLGWTALDARTFTGTELQARLREIDENLMRHELTALDRSVFLAERKAVWDAVHPDVQHGGDRKSDQVAKSGNLVLRFTADAADRLKLNERAIQRAITRYNHLHPDVRRRLSGTWLADHGAQIDALCRLPGSEQLRVVALLVAPVAEGFVRPANVAAALRQVQGIQEAAPDPDGAMFDRFLALWGRMPAGVRRRVQAHVSAGRA